MSGRKLKFMAAAAAVLMLAAGCGSSSSKSSASSTTYTVGLLTDLTGPGSPTAGTSPLGVKAGIGVAAAEGYHIKYVVADTGTTPSGALTAAQRLVDQDHVFAVIAISSLTFAASSFLASKGVPVVGVGYDAAEWLTTKNMFSVYGYIDFTKVETTTAQFVKLVGGTNLGIVGTGISPSSSDAAKSTAIAATTLGLKVGYLNANLPFGTTNVGPIALAMKAGGVDSLIPVLDQATGFSLEKAAKQNGVNLKNVVFATGGGGDLFASGPAAEAAAQGAYFSSPYEPVQVNSAATKRLQNALKTYAGVTSEPTQGEINGYVSIDGFVTGLKAAGKNPTQASFINAMLGITNYNAAGLYGSHSIGFDMAYRGTAFGADNCTFYTQFEGTDFKLVPGADPICGTILPGKKV